MATRTAAAAVFLLFAVNGALIGGVGGVLPALRERLDVSASGLSLLLFCLAASAVVSMQVGGRLADRIGARPVALVTLSLLALGVGLLSLATSLPLAIVAMVLAGLGNGAMDVAMNSLGVEVEQARPKPIMSRFHAFWSLGNLTAAATIVLIARLLDRSGGDNVGPALGTLFCFGVVGILVAVRIVPVGRRIEHHENGVRSAIPKLAWALGLMAFCFGLAEGTAVDWSSVHVTDVARIDPSTGALGLVAVSAFMVIIRLLGDQAVARVGRRAVVRVGSVTAIAGYLFTVFAEPLPLLLVGWALVGLGVGLVAPQVYAVAGHVGGGRMLAIVVTFGYAAFLIGPAIIGQLAEHFGIQNAMILPLALSACLVAVSVVLPRDE
ncbi:major facilitator superfamily MFS_1 [Kribbella flavida DSM 17836]|uniref:Major facilitator superfamily MFS_1 n=1 Tax=Kribbella flavida (strain DSM 17836 / JCM 10339 / NBRC 14399) TaxID=479435 RepID=D2PVD4_KRIFD|nr:MFS transporter [Kribbella flavida]ADB33415.1 major facilitator superfamily MFS_1 [Kribbella flavida DSM 17836]